MRSIDTPGPLALIGVIVAGVNRKQLLTQAGKLIGATYNPKRHYVTRSIAIKVKIGVDAFEEGLLRVHVYSDDPGKAALLGKHPAKPGPTPTIATAKGRLGQNGERRYYGFEWTAASSDYAPDFDRITTFVKWLKAEFASSKP